MNTKVSEAQRAVLVPIGAFDRRALAALHHAAAIPAAHKRAVHIATDSDAVQPLAHQWMAARIAMPLHVIDTLDPVPTAVGAAVQELLDDGTDEVIVVLGRQTLEHRWHRLLHNGMADAIAATVDTIPGAVPVVAVVSTFTPRVPARSASNG